MSSNVEAFDLHSSKRCSSVIAKESEKLVNLVGRLERSAADIPNWWKGDSRLGFERRLNELNSSARKLAEFVLKMSEAMDMTAESIIASELENNQEKGLE